MMQEFLALVERKENLVSTRLVAVTMFTHSEKFLELLVILEIEVNHNLEISWLNIVAAMQDCLKTELVLFVAGSPCSADVTHH